jgi:hypothetical protein
LGGRQTTNYQTYAELRDRKRRRFRQVVVIVAVLFFVVVIASIIYNAHPIRREPDFHPRVHVNGYIDKNGKYVPPHDRRK